MSEPHHFDIVKDTWIPELNTRARRYIHTNTGAELLSLENEDENKVFGVTFRTPPPDSTGLPHIMEHSVLCGSAKYPVKEPFVELLKGSLKTFLNAFTFPDKTCYPVASQNKQDFYNLIDVYLDAVFHPLIPPETLQQEGWHYELESLEDELTYKGVVFNEMKGAYGSPDSLLYRYTQQVLYPDTVYAYDAGGDPQQIPNLTYSQFKSYHETYYHPSNARFYFYGDDDPEERLMVIDRYLRDFDQQALDSTISLQARFTTPRRELRAYAAGEADEVQKGYVTVNWMLDEVGQPEKALGYTVLEHILIGTPASPLRKALIDSGLGEDLAGAGLEPDLRQVYFGTGLKGARVEDADRIEALILDTLRELVQSGIDPEAITASLNTIEFRLRENNAGSFPRGLLLMLRALTAWLYDRDPQDRLAFAEPLEQLKARLTNGESVFEAYIQEMLLDNFHRVTFVLQPDTELRQRIEAAEKGRLDAAHSAMSPAELEGVIAQTQALKLRQQAPDDPQDLAKIPSLALKDLDSYNKIVPLEVMDIAGARLLYHDLPTNEIAYLDVGFDLQQLSAEWVPFVPLLGRALVEMGTQETDFVRLAQRIGRSTGGIRSTTFASQLHTSPEATAWLFLRSKAMEAQGAELSALLREILLAPQLDNPSRFLQIVLEEKASLEAGLLPHGYQIVNQRLRSKDNPADWAVEQMHGISYLFFLRQLAEQVRSDWSAVLEILENIRARLITRQGMLFNVTLTAQDWPEFKSPLQEFIAALPDKPVERLAWHTGSQPANEGLTIPGQVNYVGKGGNLYALGYRSKGSIAVITKYLRTTWLWDRVRVQGGAYGGYSFFDLHSGYLTFLSYRDPNLIPTLEIYDQTAAFLETAEISDDELRKTIIGAIGDLDAYQLPDAKGYSSLRRYLTGYTDEQRQRWRDEILTTSVEDFRDLAASLTHIKSVGQVVVLGSPEAIQKANQERPGWLAVQTVL